MTKDQITVEEKVLPRDFLPFYNHYLVCGDYLYFPLQKASPLPNTYLKKKKKKSDIFKTWGLEQDPSA